MRLVLRGQDFVNDHFYETPKSLTKTPSQIRVNPSRPIDFLEETSSADPTRHVP